jgi:hypothetical protein
MLSHEEWEQIFIISHYSIPIADQRKIQRRLIKKNF